MAKIVSLLVAAAAVANAGVARRGEGGQSAGWNDWQASCTPEVQYSTVYSTAYSTIYSTEYKTSTVEKPTTIYNTETVPGPTVTSVSTYSVPCTTKWEDWSSAAPVTVYVTQVSTYSAPCTTQWQDWSSAAPVTVTYTETPACPTSSGWKDWNA